MGQSRQSQRHGRHGQAVRDGPPGRDKKKWVEIPKEETNPVWDPQWPEYQKGHGENVWGEYWGLPIDMLAGEVIDLMGPVRLH